MSRTGGSGKALVVRPLLELSRPDVLRYLAGRGIAYRTDSSNADPRFLRNRIRHALIPRLDEFFPHWRKAVLSAAETQRLAADFIAAEAAKRLPWRTDGGNFPGAAEWSLPRDVFFGAPEIIREEALFFGTDEFVRKSGGGVGESAARAKPPRRESIRLFTRGKCPAVDLGAVQVRERMDSVVLSSSGEPADWGFSLLIKEPGLYRLKSMTIKSQFPGSDERIDGEGFFASFPLVLRRSFSDDCVLRGGKKRSLAKVLGGSPHSGYTGVITAEDTRGIAAFIGLGGVPAVLAARRDERAGGNAGKGLPFFTVTAERDASVLNTGGLDEQRSE
jgi:tRNA(Ile)-lysidine synthase